MRILTSGLIACLACVAAYQMRPLIFADFDAQACTTSTSDLPSERIDACSRVLARRLDGPSSARALGFRGLAHWHNGETQLAVMDFDHALEIQPGSATILYDRALSYVDMRRYDDALADLEAVIAAMPDAAKGYSGRAWARFEKGDYELASIDLAKVEAMQADNAWAHNIRGFALDRIGRKAEAKAEFRRASELEPGNAGFSNDFKTAEAEQS